MADISLDDLLNKKGAAPAGEAAALTAATPEQEAVNFAKQVETISPEERAQIDDIKEKIDLTDSATALQYGVPAQKNLADFSSSVLANVRSKDNGEVGALLNNLVTQVRGIDVGEERKGSFLKSIPLIGSLVEKAQDVKQNYDTVLVQVEKIQAELEKAKMIMMKDVVMFDGLYQQNLAYFKSLELYIKAGEEKITEMREVTLPKLKQDAAASSNPMAGQVVSDFEGMVDRFEKKVHDLKISKTVAIQNAPQIRLVQNNDKILIDRVQSAIYNAIPLWKNQMVIALGLSRQQKVLETQRAVSDMTNELLRRNAEMLKQNSIETAKENERSIVDIETVKKVNDDLVTTITETLKIQQAGRAKRQAAEQELAKIEGRLKEVLLQTNTPNT